ncbi:hypothetical protein QQ045_011401 [Rhodiola kirilowii]
MAQSNNNFNDFPLAPNEMEMESSAESASIQNMEIEVNDTGTEGHQQEAAENNGFGRKPRTKKSKVWDEFEEYKVDGEVKGNRCKHCKVIAITKGREHVNNRYAKEYAYHDTDYDSYATDNDTHATDYDSYTTDNDTHATDNDTYAMDYVNNFY